MNFDQNKWGADGCILVEPAVSFEENTDLKDHLRNLISTVEDKFIPLGVKFSHSDIVSMAGKVAIEMAFPCVRPNWEGGRQNCAAGIVANGPPGIFYLLIISKY
jgi:catalase (peroxidase I)